MASPRNSSPFFCCRDRKSGRQGLLRIGEFRLKSVKNLLGQPARIGRSVYHQRRHRADDHCFGPPAFAVACQGVHHFTAAGRPK
jgi:hypothetical protein